MILSSPSVHAPESSKQLQRRAQVEFLGRRMPRCGLAAAALLIRIFTLMLLFLHPLQVCRACATLPQQRVCKTDEAACCKQDVWLRKWVWIAGNMLFKTI
eukprot:1157408-Pelagomonas_calceolata.AAC.8